MTTTVSYDPDTGYSRPASEAADLIRQAGKLLESASTLLGDALLADHGPNNTIGVHLDQALTRAQGLLNVLTRQRAGLERASQRAECASLQQTTSAAMLASHLRLEHKHAVNERESGDLCALRAMHLRVMEADQQRA